MFLRFKAQTLLKKTRLPKNEFEILASHLLRRKSFEIYLSNPGFSLAQFIKFKRIESRRLRGEPLQYLLGETEFYGLPLKVNRAVFIPRPETEVLTERVISRYRFFKEPLRILDLCTGSGNIAIALAKNLSHCQIIAADISSQALELAGSNAKLNNINNGKIKFLKSDLFNDIKGKFDIITINPPYIPTYEIKKLAKELDFEPAISLDGGIDGLDFYKRIFDRAHEFMNESSVLFMEIADNQAEQLKALLEKSKTLRLTDLIVDYNNRDRILEIESR